MANVRSKRIQAQIIRDLSHIIEFELSHYNLGFVTVTDAEVSADYAHAWIYVTFLSEAEEEAGLKKLNSAKKEIRYLLAKKVSIRKVPELHFALDDVIKKAKRIEEILAKDKK